MDCHAFLTSLNTKLAFSNRVLERRNRANRKISVFGRTKHVQELYLIAMIAVI